MPDYLALALASSGLRRRSAWRSRGRRGSRMRWRVVAGDPHRHGSGEPDRARQVVNDLAPTTGSCQVLLLLADGCRRAGLFEAPGAPMARGSQDSPPRLLALVFVASGFHARPDPTIVF
jgi:hypothetical protein